jgi:hypothetical protein
MPVRSSGSSVLRWPDRDQVERAAGEWARRVAELRPDVRRLGYFGSYARGDWGVGSDLDLIAVVGESVEPFDRRGLAFDVLSLPVPAEILVYTQAENVSGERAVASPACSPGRSSGCTSGRRGRGSAARRTRAGRRPVCSEPRPSVARPRLSPVRRGSSADGQSAPWFYGSPWCVLPNQHTVAGL